jgi:hypothetical protein
MVFTGLPNGIQALLQRLGINVGHDQPAQKTAESALKGEAKDHHTEKGSVMGDEAMLLAGVGFNVEDRQSVVKNVAEKANVERFMQELGSDKQTVAVQTTKQEGDQQGSTSKERMEKEALELKDNREDVRSEERVDTSRSEALFEARDQREQREVAGAKKEKEQEREDDREDDRNKHGNAWIPEELQREEEKKRRRGVYLDDALGVNMRCHGRLDDGSRCLRKPVPGTPYCREHAFTGFGTTE